MPREKQIHSRLSPNEGVFKNWKPATNTNKKQQLQTQEWVQRTTAMISLMLSDSSCKRLGCDFVLVGITRVRIGASWKWKRGFIFIPSHRTLPLMQSKQVVSLWSRTPWILFHQTLELNVQKQTVNTWVLPILPNTRCRLHNRKETGRKQRCSETKICCFVHLRINHSKIKQQQQQQPTTTKSLLENINLSKKADLSPTVTEIKTKRMLF